MCIHPRASSEGDRETVDSMCRFVVDTIVCEI